MSVPAIVIKDLTFQYRRKLVLNELSWNIGPGFVGLLGPNGAGKTTFLNCLVGLARPKSGSINFADGLSVRIGYVQQRATLPPSMRVRDSIEYSAWLHGVPSRDIAQAATDAIDLLGLVELAGRRNRALSGGERQRVAIAAAVTHRPSILVLDEPTVGLDPSHRLAVRRAVKGLDGLECVLVATHLIEDVEYLCSDVGILSDGQLRFAGPVSELLQRQATHVSDGSRYGSPFEVAYEALIEPRARRDV